MTNEVPPTLESIPSEPTPMAAAQGPLIPKKSRKKLWLGLGIGTGVLGLCIILCLVITGGTFIRIMFERAPVASVVDQFMDDLVAKDVQSAYELFSPRAKRQVSITKLQEFIQGNNYILFKGYQSLSVDSLQLLAAANSNPDMPQGTVAKASGTIQYEGGFQGTFAATLEKVDGKWMMFFINITVPPNKITY